jgi:hypothetical protein
MANMRSCLVSFTDSEGIEHTVRVPAETLYEAAVEAMAAFRRCVFADVTLGSGTPLKIRVRGPEEGTHRHRREGALVAGGHREQSEREAEEEPIAGAAAGLSCSRVRCAIPRGLTVRSRVQLSTPRLLRSNALREGTLALPLQSTKYRLRGCKSLLHKRPAARNRGTFCGSEDS